MTVRAKFDLEGDISKMSKINLWSYKVASELVLYPSFMHSPTVSPNFDVASDASQVEKAPDLILTTRNDENLKKLKLR